MVLTVQVICPSPNWEILMEVFFFSLAGSGQMLTSSIVEFLMGIFHSSPINKNIQEHENIWNFKYFLLQINYE